MQICIKNGQLPVEVILATYIINQKEMNNSLINLNLMSLFFKVYQKCFLIISLQNIFQHMRDVLARYKNTFLSYAFLLHIYIILAFLRFKLGFKPGDQQGKKFCVRKINKKNKQLVYVYQFFIDRHISINNIYIQQQQQQYCCKSFLGHNENTPQNSAVFLQLLKCSLNKLAAIFFEFYQLSSQTKIYFFKKVQIV
eukprot:TRINITY_DN7751_c0_g4_i3.p2 TRINITY_DN7751_c0_g4~~TRINITY_DN7751_c0_g4_i3.p2  ORF type:complete len:196 (-),score=-10.78 TRINITY_DN7751_c0_g4_i3:256-843(-)